MHVLLKIGGPRCVTSATLCVAKCDSGRGSKFVKNSVTYFMDHSFMIVYSEALIVL